jgi:hypothetical protein
MRPSFLLLRYTLYPIAALFPLRQKTGNERVWNEIGLQWKDRKTANLSARKKASHPAQQNKDLGSLPYGSARYFSRR